VKKRTPIWWAELYLALNPPGHGFPVLETPEQRRGNDVCSAEELLGFDIAFRAYHAWKREGASNLESTIFSAGGVERSTPICDRSEIFCYVGLMPQV
jgi:hypothetical protein